MKTHLYIALPKPQLVNLCFQLVAPDVTPDLYVPLDEDDDDWARFLRDFNVPVEAAHNDTQEEEEDEEYVFQVRLR